MVRLSKKALVDRAIDAIGADGWTITRLTASGTHPARFEMTNDGVSHLVRLYIWNLSHGGKSRSDSEFRIQVTGIDTFQAEPGGRTLILGWDEDFGVFAGFDIMHRLGPLGASASIQVTTATLGAARADGAGRQDKKKGEWAIAVRPDKLWRYVQHLRSAHSGNLEPILAGDDDPAADPLASQILQVSDDASGFDISRAGEAGLRSEIIAGVDDVLTALGDDSATAPPEIGHNKPPELIEDHAELGFEIKAAAQRIEAELKSESLDPRKVGEAGGFLAYARRILEAAKREGAAVLDKGKDLAREYMVKALWGVTGTVTVTFKEEILDLLRKLAGSVLTWLQHIAIF